MQLLGQLLDEATEVSARLLDIILERLLAPARAEHLAAHR